MPNPVDALDDAFAEKKVYRIYAQCFDCLDWTLIEETIDNYGKGTMNAACEHCGHKNLDPRSATSESTFNPETAKRRRPGKR